MIISAEGDVSIHHCFEAMLISLQEDYRQNTLRQLSRDDIKAGINYVKHYGKYKERTVRVLITALEAPQLYTACFIQSWDKGIGLSIRGSGGESD